MHKKLHLLTVPVGSFGAVIAYTWILNNAESATKLMWTLALLGIFCSIVIGYFPGNKRLPKGFFQAATQVCVLGLVLTFCFGFINQGMKLASLITIGWPLFYYRYLQKKQ